MKKSRNAKKEPGKRKFWLYLFVLLISFAVSTGLSYFYLKDKFAFDSDFIAAIESRQAAARNMFREKGDNRLYGARNQDQADSDSVVLRKDAWLVVAEDTIRNYVKSYEVRLLDLYMDKEGIIYIDFGDELTRNFKGDALEELKIISGLYRGLKSSVPGFTALKILISGREIDSIGGHIDISKPVGAEIADVI